MNMFLQTKVVLLVENNFHERELMADLLRHYGLTVDVAADGAEALKRLVDRVPSLVLTDFKMPNMNGVELAIHLKSEAAYHHIPVVMISATPPYADGEDVGISCFMQKPSRLEDVIAVIRKYI
jgi:CheY-like chemotaxis protein